MKTDTIRVNGFEMEYFTFGAGKRPFVILPGVSVKSVMLSAKAVEAAYRMFGDTYTVYVFDRRKNMPDPYPVRQMAQDTAAAMCAIGIGDADIFGASQGGMMAMCLAIDHPELVHKTALGSTASYADEKIIAGTRRWVSLAQSGDRTALTAELIDCLYSENTIGKYRELLMHMNDDLSGVDLTRFIIQTEAISGFDIAGELDRIQCPVLVIGVEGDKVLDCKHSRFIADRLGCQLYVYGSEYGHCVFDEAPDYKQRLLDFFQER